VVVAVVDGGFFITHQDLNFWKNYAEIPGNSIDDDNNGYIDDVNGWNAFQIVEHITASQHGTHVSGTVAAKG
jgi:serine protease